MVKLVKNYLQHIAGKKLRLKRFVLHLGRVKDWLLHGGWLCAFNLTLGTKWIRRDWGVHILTNVLIHRLTRLSLNNGQ